MDHTDKIGTQEPRSSVKLATFAPLLIVVITVLAYANSLQGPMIFDDIPSIQNNHSIRQLWPLSVPLRTVPVGAFHSRPIANLSLAINYALGGLDAPGYHAFNLLIHILTALLLYGVVRRTLTLERFRDTFNQSATGIATTVALIWSVHPLTTSAVTYISQRTEGLMALFYLLTIYCTIRGATSSHGSCWYPAAAVACALGMGSKEVMVSAPLIVLLYDRTFLSPSFRHAWQRRWGLYLALATTWLVVAAGCFTTNFNVKRGGGDPLTVFEYLRTQSEVLVRYVQLSFWPNPLVLDYLDWPVAPLSVSLVASCLAVLAVLATTVWALRFRPACGFLGAFFFLILAPTSSFLPLWGELAAERRMYLPLMPIIVLVVVGCYKGLMVAVAKRTLSATQCRWASTITVAALLTALIVATIQRNEDYRGALAIWSDTAAKRPGNWRAFTEVGTALAADKRFAEAINNYEHALQLRPDYAMAYANWGVALGMEGKLDDAMTKLQKALELNPRSAYAHYNLGLAFSKQGRTDLAKAQFAEALRIDPTLSKARVRLEQAKI
jgi:protein O-mannosyl-transferase